MVPELRAEDASFEVFSELYDRHQILVVRNGNRTARHKHPGLASLRRVYEQHPKVVRRAFCLENAPAKDRHKRVTSKPHDDCCDCPHHHGSASKLEDDDISRILGTNPAPGPWYASFVVQRNKTALSSFLAEVLPAGTPEFLLRPSRHSASASPPKAQHSDAIWVFFGRNPGTKPLVGRSEHTDAITHSGTWHVQLSGSKVWNLRPTAELVRKVPSLRGRASVRVRCNEGDVLCINTRHWWHSTRIPARCPFTLSIARDMYLDGRKPNACDMTNVIGHYALHPIRSGEIVFTEDDAPDLELPRAAVSNCGLRELHGKLVVVAKRRIKVGDWLSLSDSEEEGPEPEPKRRRHST